MASQKGLGKGLGALLGDFNDVSTEKSPYQILPIYKVEPNPDQPRQDFDEEELHPCIYEETESYQVTEMFINNREYLLKRLLSTQTEDQEIGENEV